MEVLDSFIVFFVTSVLFLLTIVSVIIYKRERSEELYREFDGLEPRDYN